MLCTDAGEFVGVLAGSWGGYLWLLFSEGSRI